ncbi:MAG: hypothetical protein ACFFAU_18820 [Candidatus Hodarchaeota archaeon]
MKKQQRLDIIHSCLNKILNEGGSANLVIFTDPDSTKFVQFIGKRGGRLLLIDIPKVELKADEERRLNEIFSPLLEPTEYTYQAQVTPDQGVKVTEKIFRGVFLSPDTYNIGTEINLK